MHLVNKAIHNFSKKFEIPIERSFQVYIYLQYNGKFHYFKNISGM